MHNEIIRKMKRFLLILLVPFLIAVLVGISTFLLLELFPERGKEILSLVSLDSFRSNVYPRDSDNTSFPGSGEIRVSKSQRLLVISQEKGGPIEEIDYESQEQIDALAQKGKKVHLLPANNNYLEYTVGKFKEWKDIEGSEDRLINLVDPSNSSKTYTYRLARINIDSPNYHFNPDRITTRIDVERLDSPETGQTNSIQVFLLATEVSNEELDKIFKVGDIVIATPVPQYPDLQAFDEQGVRFANVLTIRRKNGVDIKRQI